MSGGTFYILGSGASSAVPWLACALAPRVVSDEPLGANIPDSCCAVCADAIDNPLGPNKRGNVSAALRLERPDGNGDFCVVIDCGKTFRDTVGRVWPRLDPPLRRIDALLLTHPHADAFIGMDCLREVAPSDPVHVYCHAPTFERVRWAFPYLVPAGAGGEVDSKNISPPALPTSSACCDPIPPTPAVAIPATYVATLIFHIVTPWVPFELVGSGGLLVTPIPVEHAGASGTPTYSDADTCLAFEFGAALHNSSNSSSSSNINNIISTSGGGDNDNNLVGFDTRGLPTLPPWKGDRILWVSDVRALSAQVRAYFSSRPTTLLLIDALGFRDYPTHFSISQALAAAVDMMGPGSATAAATAAAAALVTASNGGGNGISSSSHPRVRLVGINHEVEHVVEQERLVQWAARARIVRPASGGEPLAWVSPTSQHGSPLDLDIRLGHDGLTQAVVFGARYTSIADLIAEITAVRNAATVLAAEDATDYINMARARSVTVATAREAEASGSAEPPLPNYSQEVSSSSSSSSLRLGTTVLRHREDFVDCLPFEFKTYAESPSAVVRKNWKFKASAYRVTPKK